MMKDGHTQADLARRLRYKTPALQRKTEFVTVRSAHLVGRLAEQLRSTRSKRTLAMIETLKEEGYTQRQIQQRLAELASAAGEETPTLEPRNGRVTEKAAALVERLYRQMTA